MLLGYFDQSGKSVNSAKSWKFCFMKAKKFVEVSQQLLSNSYPFPVSVISGMLQQAKFFQQIGDSQVNLFS